MGNESEYRKSNSNIRKRKPFVNTSGQGAKAKVPQSVKDNFNWGAFFLSWIWGLGNKTYITLINIVLFFIPLVNLGVAIWFGIKGNEWAWRNKRFEGINQFHENQKGWATAGIIFFIIFIPVCLFLFTAGFTFYSVKSVMDNPEKLDNSLAKLEKFMDETVSMTFETYTIDENENKFYVQEDMWQTLDFSGRKNILDLAASTAARNKEKKYKENNPDGHKYYSKTDELNKTRIYSANNRDRLLAEFHIDSELMHNTDTSFTDLMKAGMKAYRFYNPSDNVKAQPLQNNNVSDDIDANDFFYRQERSNLRKCSAVLNQAITINYAYNKTYITRTSDFMEMFLQRTSPNPVRTSDNSFRTSDGNNYTIVPLREICDMSNEPCAKILINNKYELLLYQNKVMPRENSKEQKILFGNNYQNNQTSSVNYEQRQTHSYSSSNNIRVQEERSTLKKCMSGLNQALSLDYALEKKYITRTSDFIGLFTKRMSVLSEKTTNNSFTTADNNYFFIIPLRETCDMSGKPCARIILNNKFELNLYQNKVEPLENTYTSRILSD